MSIKNNIKNEYKLAYLTAIKAIANCFNGEERDNYIKRLSSLYTELYTENKNICNSKIKTVVEEPIKQEIKKEKIDDNQRQLDEFDMLFR